MDTALPIKHHSLTGRIDLPLMHAAFRAVKRNKGKAGVDRVSIELFAQQLDQNLIALMRDLKQGTFQPLPVLRKYIDKGGGKFRPLGIPTVRDRVAQEVLRRLLSPLFESEFHDNSQGFRPGRSCHTAMERLLDIWRSGHRHLLDADISGFFDNIPHHVVMKGLSQVVADGNILNLVQKFLTAGVMEDGVVQSTTLTLSPTKTKVTTFMKGFTFLGFDVSSWSVKMRAKSVENFKTRIRELTVRSHNLDAEVIAKLNSVVRGVSRYFGTWFTKCRKQFRELDEWLRVRLRCQRLKRKSREDNRRIKIQHQQRAGCRFLSDWPQPTRMTVRSRPSHEAIPSRATSRRKASRATGPPGAGKPHAGK